MSLGILDKEKKYRKIWVYNELKLLSLNYLVSSDIVKKRLRCLLLVEKLKKAPRFSRTRLVNYCIISGNPRWVFKKIHYSRQEVKKAVSKRVLMGFRKASW